MRRCGGGSVDTEILFKSNYEMHIESGSIFPTKYLSYLSSGCLWSHLTYLDGISCKYSKGASSINNFLVLSDYFFK